MVTLRMGTVARRLCQTIPETPSCGTCNDVTDNDGDGQTDAQDSDCATSVPPGEIYGVWRAKGLCGIADVNWVYQIEPLGQGNVTATELPTSLTFTQQGLVYVFVGDEPATSGTYDGVNLQLDPYLVYMETESPHPYCGLSWTVGPVSYGQFSVVDTDGDGQADVMTAPMLAENHECGDQYSCMLTLSRISSTTLPGSDVRIELVSGDQIVFSEVNSPGQTYSFDILGSIAALPDGSQVLSERVFADAGTTAGTAGGIQVCLQYADADDDGIVDGTDPPVEETALGIVHNEGGIFVDRKVSVDPVNNRVCAGSTSLSEFAVGIFSFLCAEAPRLDCRNGEQSRLVLRKNENDGQDRLVWRWTERSTPVAADFGDPTGDTNYALCIYDVNRRVVAVELYGKQSNWSPIAAHGYRYRANKRRPGGIRSINLKASSSSKVILAVKGKGENLPEMALDLALPVTVQLISSEGACWESLFGVEDVIANDSKLFKAIDSVNAGSKSSATQAVFKRDNSGSSLRQAKPVR